MGIMRYLGVGEARMIAQNSIAAGTVREVWPCYWLKVNRKAVRALAGDEAEVAGEHIAVYYDKGAPEKWALCIGAVYLVSDRPR